MTLNDAERENYFRTGLYALCEKLHMHTTGSGDWVEPSEVGKISTYLTDRLENWKPGRDASAPFDDAVRALVMATLAELQVNAA